MVHKTRRNHLLVSTPLLAALITVPTAGHGQNAEADQPVMLQEIQVSGERQTRSISETYSGVSVLTEEDLPTNDQIHLNDALANTPNLFVEGDSEYPSLRGLQGGGAGGLVSSGLTGALPRLPIVIDNVTRPAALPNSSGASLWDVEQVEVFRGPQTVLRGRSGIAGAIVVKTKDPTFEPEAALQIGLADDAYTGIDRVINGMASGPLSENVAVRFSVETQEGTDPRRATDVEDDWMIEYHSLRARGKLYADFDTAMGLLTTKVLLEHQVAQTPQTRNNVHGEALTGEPNSERILVNSLSGALGIPTRTFDTWSTTVSLDNTLALGSGDLQFLSSFTTDDYDTIAEQVYSSVIEGEEDIFTQDIIFNFGTNGNMSAKELGGLVGLAIEERTQDTEVGGPFSYTSDVRTSSQSIFTDLRYGLTDKWTVFGGARYQRFHDNRHQNSSVGATNGVQDFDNDEYAFLPALGIAYEISPKDTVSVSARRGYNPGGTSVNLFTGEPFVYESEKVWTYEATYRHVAPMNGITFGATAFYNVFDNPQFYGETTPGNRATLQVTNHNEGVSYGLELDGTWQPMPKLRLTGALGLLSTEITEADDSAPDVEGNTFGQDPDWTGSVGAVYQVQDWISVDGRVTYRGESHNDFNNTAGDEVGDYAIVDLGVTADYKSFQFRAYVDNVLDETGITRYVSDRTFVDVTNPITVGLTATARF